MSLQQALRNLTEGSGYFEEAKQFIIRLYDYTDLNQGIGIDRVNSSEIVPTYLDQPIWAISFEGVNARSPGRQPTTYKEVTLQIDAVTGKTLGGGSFR